MHTFPLRGIAAAIILSSLASGCSSATPATTTASPPVTARSPSPAPAMSDMPGMSGMEGMDHEHMPGMSAPITIPKGAHYTEADVRFMQGMIAHHGQAIYMSRLATARGANPRVLKFANKIDQSQQAEIRLMQGWLGANHQSVPDADSWRTMSMPGMLTPAQLAQLDAARGVDFDRAFLIMMIQHHTGALRMVTDLLATPMAAQDVDVSVFANDVQTVQTVEIETMRQMLETL